MIYSAALCAAALAALFIAAAMGAGLVAGIAKMIASTAFLSVALCGGALHSTYGRVLLAGLFFAWWGDFFLLSSQRTLFLLGLVAFLLGHVLYVAAFAVRGVDFMWSASALVALGLIAAPIVLWLNPHLGSMRLPVYAYIAVITIMLACALGAWPRGAGLLIPLGAFLFYLSDLCVSRERFVTHGIENRALGLPLYYAGQVLLAWSVVAAQPRV